MFFKYVYAICVYHKVKCATSYAGYASNGEFNYMRSKGHTRPLFVLQIRANVCNKYNRIKEETLLNMLTPEGTNIHVHTSALVGFTISRVQLLITPGFLINISFHIVYASVNLVLIFTFSQNSLMEPSEQEVSTLLYQLMSLPRLLGG